MPEIAPSREVSAQDAYRPLSALAVAGTILALASLFLFALPELPWLLALIPVPAFFVSLAARRRVRRSEGTLAGYHLAGFGMAISLVIVLGYLTRYFTEYWVIRYESAQFVERWLHKVRDGKEGSAFLDTVAPHERRVTFHPEDLRRLRPHYPQMNNPNVSMFDQFRRSLLIGTLFRSRDRIEWKHLGVADWGHGISGYEIKHRYWISTPELSGEVLLNATSQIVNSPSGPRREWRLYASDASFVQESVKVSEYGQELKDAQAEANRAINRWVRNVAEGKRAEAEQTLAAPVAPDLQADFNHLYSTVRRNLNPQETAILTLRDTYLVADAKDKNTWSLEYRGIVDIGQRELDVRFRVRTDDLKLGPAGWRIAASKFHGERKKIEGDVGSGVSSMRGPTIRDPGAGEGPQR